MLKWLLAGVLVLTIGWVGMVHRRPGPGLGPSAAMALSESAQAEADAKKGVQIRIPDVDYAAVLSHDPFGGSPGLAGQTREGDSEGESVSEALGVTLVGTVSGSAPLARVVLRDVKTKATTVYRIGDHVGGAILESVAKESAVFLAGQRRLVLKRSAVGSKGTTPAAPSGDRVAEDLASVTPAAAEPHTTTPRAAAAAMGEFLDKVTVTPARGENGAEGLRITGLDQIPAARQLGLEEGDVICAVNGQSLADPRKAFQVFRKVKSQDSIQVDLVRKGQSKTLSLNLR
jgi:type II secretory pathway component PulC